MNHLVVTNTAYHCRTTFTASANSASAVRTTAEAAELAAGTFVQLVAAFVDLLRFGFAAYEIGAVV